MRRLAFALVALSALATAGSVWLVLPGRPALTPSESASPATQRLAEPTAPQRAVVEFLRQRHTGLADAEVPRVAATLVRAAERHDLDLDLLLALIFVESSGYNFAVSPVGARGLMQIMPRTGEELAQRLGRPWPGPDALFDPVLNLDLGTAYLRQLLNRYDGHLEKALTAYNAGPGFVDRRLARGAQLPRSYSRLVRGAIAQRSAERS